jgi:hypothetical protein
MHALPALSLIATDAIRRQFATTGVPEPERAQVRIASRSRIALAALLERAARAVAPAGGVPAH